MWEHNRDHKHMLLAYTGRTCFTNTVLEYLYRFGEKGTATPKRKLDYSWTMARFLWWVWQIKCLHTKNLIICILESGTTPNTVIYPDNTIPLLAQILRTDLLMEQLYHHTLVPELIHSYTNSGAMTYLTTVSLIFPHNYERKYKRFPW